MYKICVQRLSGLLTKFAEKVRIFSDWIADGNGEYFPVMCHKEHTYLIAAIPTDPWYIELGEWALDLWEGCYGVSSNLHVQNTCLNLLHRRMLL